MIAAIVFFGCVTLFLFLLTILISRKIGDDSTEGFDWLLFGWVGVAIGSIEAILRGVFRGEFNHPFELGVLISFFISLIVFLALVGIQIF